MSEYKKYLDDLNAELTFYTRQLSTIQKKFKKNTKGDFQNILDSLHHLLQEAESSYSQLKTASKAEWEPLKKIAIESFSQLRILFDKFLHDTSEQAQEYVTQFKAYSAELVEDLEDYISSNPFKSILIAAGLGFIIGKILK